MAQSVEVPNLAVRLSLGYRLNEHLSAQLSYMRPARWVSYRNINGDQAGHSVWMNVASATVKARTSSWHGLSAYGEGGLGVVTRHGIEVAGTTIVQDAVHATPLVGGGLEYALANDWALAVGATR